MQTVDLRSHLDRRLPIGLVLLALSGFIVWKGFEPNQTGRLIFGLAVGFFGLLAVAERRLVEIDEQAGTLTKKLGLVLAFKVRTLALAEIKSVVLSVYSRGNKGKQRRYRLSVTGSKDGAITEHVNEWYARQAAERLSAALRVPLDNRVYGPRSVRKSDELDMPLAARWRASGKIKEPPVLPGDTQIDIETFAAGVRVRLPADTSGRWIVAAITACFLGVGAAFYWSTQGAPEYFLVYFGVGLGLMFLCYGLLALSGRSRLTFTGRSIAFRQGWAPRERSIEMKAIEEMISGWDAIYLVGDAAMLAIHWPASEADCDFLEAFVAYQIARNSS